MIDDAYESLPQSDGKRILKLSLVALLLILTGLGTMIMDRDASPPMATAQLAR